MAEEAWRLLVHGPAPGPWNMGADEALLASAGRGRPALRLYAWDGPWLSLGYAQRLAGDRLEACRDAGVGVVRRTTGGGAVLHGADFTYAIAAPEACLPAGLRPTYAAIAGGLVAGLRSLGVAAERSPAGSEPRPGRVYDCFAVPAGDEICVAGRKLVGSAQRRVGGGVLQHGSIRLAADPAAAAAAAGIGDERATSLAELGLGREAGALRDALIGALGSALAARFEDSDLTPEEAARAVRRGPEPPDRESENTLGASQGCSSQADT